MLMILELKSKGACRTKAIDLEVYSSKKVEKLMALYRKIYGYCEIIDYVRKDAIL